MSDHWIKFRKKLLRDGRTRRLARALGVHRHRAIGMLIELWALADEHGDPNSGGLGMCADDVDHDLEFEGFCAKLAESVPGWLELSGDPSKPGELEVILPQFALHNGFAAKARVQKNERQARYRAASGARASTPAPPKRHIDETRQDKTRKERAMLAHGSASEESDAPKEGVEKKPAGKGKADEVFALWNTKAAAHPGRLKTARKLSKARRQKINLRLKAGDWRADLEQALGKLPLARSRDGSDWQPDLDWLIRGPDQVSSILEGKFDWRSDKEPGGGLPRAKKDPALEREIVRAKLVKQARAAKRELSDADLERLVDRELEMRAAAS